MSKMTIVQLGVVVFVLCLSTQQVVSQTNTSTTAGANSTSTSSSNSTTTMATDIYSSANSTSPTAAGVSLHPGSFSFLVPVITAASLLQRYC